jgi:type I restriction enzyme, R subunit
MTKEPGEGFLTATPRRIDNSDTYKYFGDPVYTYSLKDGIEDGFLTPYKVKRVSTTMDEYIYTSDDRILEGEAEEGRVYEEKDFAQGNIHIREREEARVKILLDNINQNEKTIVFCATQSHALLIRDLVNKHKTSTDPNYCVRVTANDGMLGEQYLREFQDNDKTIPTILTTSQKLSTGVDAKDVRNIVLMRPVNSMIEFKQIVGRGTRLYEGKDYFTIIDFVNAYKNFLDPAWDGEPINETTVSETGEERKPKESKEKIVVQSEGGLQNTEPKEKLKIKLRDGKEREIQHMVSTVFFNADGKPVSAKEYIGSMFGALPQFFKTEEELREIWSNPVTRKALLEKLAEAGFGKEQLESVQKIIDAENSDIFDVLGYIGFAVPTISRVERIEHNKDTILEGLDEKHKEFIEFVLAKYQEKGAEELDEAKLSPLLILKYHALSDAENTLGAVGAIRSIFFNFQRLLYSR